MIQVTRDDIVRVPVDAVVNAANTALAPGSGVCGAIFAAAGPGLVDACSAIGHCATGDAVITPGFDLPARWIVHTVGPVWRGGDHDEEALLATCYRRSLEVAAAHGARSVAFPAISTGVFGYPADAAARVAVSAVQDPPAGIDEIVLVAFDDATAARYRELLSSPGDP